MATIQDLYTAWFGYQNTYNAARRYEKPVQDGFDLIKPFYFLLPLKTSNNMTLNVRVDARSAFSSIFSLMDFAYSNTYKNYTLSKGTRGQARTSITLPKPGDIKKTPEYLQFVEDHKAWTAARLAAVRNASDAGLLAELLSFNPDAQTFLDLKDDEVKAHFESLGWTIDDKVEFHNWRPRGWIMTSGPDGYGHNAGLYANMDWDKKTITVSGWSSDD